ncbi:hypothetical protein [Coxiella-like endosymbiont]|uniref:hypothetical protein n=1 Tax=Coxiella-like endosymbiont TaxID=1592897 RepID=UPI0027297CBB|nr:hypothetical protein [Coxiella-like endosymbiont]
MTEPSRLRLFNYHEGGPFTAEEFNDTLDHLFVIEQEIKALTMNHRLLFLVNKALIICLS